MSFSETPQTDSPFSIPASRVSGENLTGFFDFGFTRFVTNTWISIIWRIAVALIFIAWGCWVIGGLATMANVDPLMGIGIILLVTVVVPIELLLIRMVLEFVIVVFRIETHLRTLKDNSEATKNNRE